MAFWGVEVKPGKPVIHSCETARGRLRISQATLGISDATKKSIVQCNVGNKSPVLLCALLPNQTESCHLDLEFEEADDVTFSVIGPRSVYLTGYYVRQIQHCSPQSDSESHGVDIANTESEESSYRREDEEYEDSFIDDDEQQKFSPSPVASNKVDESVSENEKPNKGKGQRRRLKKNHQVVESDSENDKPNNGKGQNGQLKKNCQVVESDSENDKPNNGKDQHRRSKNNRQVVESDDSEDDDGFLLSFFKSKKTENTTTTGVEAKSVNQNVTTNNGKDQMHALDLEKPNKKRKERSEQEKTCEADSNDKGNEFEAYKPLDSEAHQSVPPELDSGKSRKSKRRRKQVKLEETVKEEMDVKSENVAKDDDLKPVKEEMDVKSENVAKDDDLERSLLHSDSKKDVQAINRDREQQIDNNISTKSGLLDNDSKPEKKKSKKTKKKKNQGNGEPEMVLPDTGCNQETTPEKSENQTSNAEPTQNRTLSNGLIIEEVVNGPPEGKVASRGKKVKVFYTAMLKENGHVFDSNVGKSPLKIRLGNEGTTDGWNLGVEGMHVGDKRRLIVPPSLGFGKNGAGENVPPESWLVYDVELAGVYR